MKKSLLSLVIATVVIPALVISAEDMSTYLCIVDQGTGYEYVDGEWVQRKFKGGSKYIFKGNFDSANSKGEWYEFGKDGYWRPNCEVDALYEKCNTFYGRFTLRSEGLRFTGHQIYPYLNIAGDWDVPGYKEGYNQGYVDGSNDCIHRND